jgi:HSP20 family molecular chaperone IbpA
MTADIYESPGGDAFILEIPVPGLEQEEITVEAEGDSLSVTTRPLPGVELAGRRYIRQEQVLKPMSRVFEFPCEINTGP